MNLQEPKQNGLRTHSPDAGTMEVISMRCRNAPAAVARYLFVVQKTLLSFIPVCIRLSAASNIHAGTGIFAESIGKETSSL